MLKIVDKKNGIEWIKAGDTYKTAIGEYLHASITGTSKKLVITNLSDPKKSVTFAKQDESKHFYKAMSYLNRVGAVQVDLELSEA
jgi:hypothetical protein